MKHHRRLPIEYHLVFVNPEFMIYSLPPRNFTFGKSIFSCEMPRNTPEWQVSFVSHFLQYNFIVFANNELYAPNSLNYTPRP